MNRMIASGWVCCCLLRGWFVATRASDAQELGEMGGPTPNLEIQAELSDQKYCAVTPDDDVVSLSVRFSVSVRNRTEGSVILARKPKGGSPTVAASAEAAGAGLIEFVYDYHWYPQADDKRRFRGSPSRKDVVVLRRGDAYTTYVDSVVFVHRKGAEAIEGTFRDGSRHAIQVPIQWWSPFEALSEEEVAELRRRWLRYGVLVVGNSPTNWVEVSLPEIGRPEECGQ